MHKEQELGSMVATAANTRAAFGSEPRTGGGGLTASASHPCHRRQHRAMRAMTSSFCASLANSGSNDPSSRRCPLPAGASVPATHLRPPSRTACQFLGQHNPGRDHPSASSLPHPLRCCSGPQIHPPVRMHRPLNTPRRRDGEIANPYFGILEAVAARLSARAVHPPRCRQHPAWLRPTARRTSIIFLRTLLASHPDFPVRIACVGLGCPQRRVCCFRSQS